MTCDRKPEPSLLDLTHTDGRSTRPLNHNRIRPQATIADNRREVVQVDDVVELGTGRNRHRQLGAFCGGCPSLSTPNRLV